MKEKGHYLTCMYYNIKSSLYRSSQVSLARIEELRAVIRKQELEMENLKDQLKQMVLLTYYYKELKKKFTQYFFFFQ